MKNVILIAQIIACMSVLYSIARAIMAYHECERDYYVYMCTLSVIITLFLGVL